MTIRAPFKPHYGSNQVVTANNTSASKDIDKQDKSVRIANTGANKAYFRIGEGSQTATTADCCVASGGSIVVEKGIGQDTIAYISAAGTTLEIMTGEGGFN